ncbi:hypothetical protein HOG48_02140 [Candidatus Peregrinibacteria bacterium]|jgi:hypothetical protein|nr:hypothetical protein [Candidatus Peregrinibacteria bacterium]
MFKKLRKNLVTILIIVNIIFTILFTLWFFVEVPVKKFHDTEITSHNIFEAAYYATRDRRWNAALEKIKVIEDAEEKKTELHNYIEDIPVTQWFNLLYPYQNKAFGELSTLYKDDEQWPELRELSQKYIEIDPRNAKYYYLIGLSYFHEGGLEKAETAYYETLEIDATHVGTLKQLGSLLISKGQYYKIRRILEPYVVSSSYLTNKMCFFWGETGFTGTQKKCQTIQLDDNQRKTVTHWPGEILNNINQLKYVRIDPPQGTFKVESVKINIRNAPVLNYTTFSNWNRSADVKHLEANEFTTVGNDPYIYTILKSGIAVEEIESVEFDLTYTAVGTDKEIIQFIQMIDTKNL